MPCGDYIQVRATKIDKCERAPLPARADSSQADRHAGSHTDSAGTSGDCMFLISV